MNHIDTPQTRCRAGVARANITPPVGIYHRMWGAASHDCATAVHRPLLATALWMEPASGDPSRALLVVALDHCVIDSVEMKQFADAIGQATGLQSPQVLVALSHTHGSGWMSRSRSHLPGGERIGPYFDRLTAELASVAVRARTDARPATIAYGQGRCALAANRDYRDEAAGQFVCGLNPQGPADDTVVVARVTDSSGIIATVVNYACHPTTLAWDNTAISPDYVGAMREIVEQATAAPCVFLQGASGDLGPREGFVGDWTVADRNGRQLGFSCLAALEALPPAGTRFIYAGPVVSGATLGTWKHVALDADALVRQETWEVQRSVVDLPYRDDQPTLEQSQVDRDRWHADEEQARGAGDTAKARDCRAMVERMDRRIHRLGSIPAGKAFPYLVTAARLGDAVWLFVPGELYQVFQVTLRERFPGMPLVVVTLTNDWQPGYLPAASAYGRGIYQETIAVVAPGTLEALIETVTRQIRSLG